MSGSAQDLHDLDLHEHRGARTLGVVELRPTRPAIVLGSAQPSTIVDAEAAELAGFDVARRRSGGGLVVVDSAVARWLDVVIAREHPMWDDDVIRASRWIGAAWRASLMRSSPEAASAARIDVAQVTDRNRDGSWVCFWGVGPGEVTVAGAKLVGLSQRRDRGGARFQCQFHTVWDPAPWLGLLRPNLDADERSAVPLVTTIGESVADATIEAFVDQIRGVV